MGKKLDVSDYYLGIITATSEYFNNPKRHRYLGTVDFDPFLEKAPMEAILFGIPTLLKKIEKMEKFIILTRSILDIKMNSFMNYMRRML